MGIDSCIEFKQTLIDALFILQRSCGKVTSAVQICFRHVGFEDKTVEENKLEEQPNEVARTLFPVKNQVTHTTWTNSSTSMKSYLQ